MSAEPSQLIIVLHDDLVPGEPAGRAAAQLQGGLLPALEALESSPALRLAWAPSPALCRAIAELPTAAALLERLRALSAKGRLEGVVRVSAALMLLPPGALTTGLLRAQQATLQRILGTPARGFWPEAGAYDPQLPALLQAAGLAFTFIDSGALRGGGVRPDAGAWRVERAGVAVSALAIDRRLCALGPPLAVAALGAELSRRPGRSLVLPLALGDLAAAGPAYWPELSAALVRIARICRINVPWAVLERSPAAWAAPRAGTPPRVGAAALPEAPGEALCAAEAALLGLRDPVLAEAVGELQGPPFEAFIARFDAAFRLVSAGTRAIARAGGARRAGSPGAEAAAAATARLLPAGALHAGEGGQLDDPAVRHAAWLAWLAVEAPLLPEGPTVEAPERPQDPGAIIEVRAPRWLLRLRPREGGGLDLLALPGFGNLINTMERQARVGHAALRAAASLPALLDEPLPEADAQTDAPEERTDPGRAPSPPPERAEAEPAPVPPRPAAPCLAGDPSQLAYEDAHLRHFIVERFMGEGLDARALWRGQAPELSDPRAAWRVERAEALSGAEAEGGPAGGAARIVLAREASIARVGAPAGMVQITRRMLIFGEGPTIEVEWELVNRSREPVELHLLVELNVNLDGALGPERSLHTPGAAPQPFDAVGEVRGVADIGLRFGDLGALLRVQVEPAVRLLHHPIEGPLQRDGQIVSAFQGVCLGLDFQLSLWGEERQRRSARVELLRR